MKTQIPIKQFLQWRQAQAEAEAPPPPRAARLLEMARPWRELWPELVREGHLVPARIVTAQESIESLVRVSSFAVRDGRLRLRLHMDGVPRGDSSSFEVTLVCNASQRPVACAGATASADGEFHLEMALPPEGAGGWAQLKVTDRAPFRLILRASDA